MPSRVLFLTLCSTGDKEGADFCKKNHDEKGELFYLDRIFQMYVRSNNDYYCAFAEFLYKECVSFEMNRAIHEVGENKLHNLELEGENMGSISIRSPDNNHEKDSQ